LLISPEIENVIKPKPQKWPAASFALLLSRFHLINLLGQVTIKPKEQASPRPQKGNEILLAICRLTIAGKSTRKALLNGKIDATDALCLFWMSFNRLFKQTN